MTLSKLHLDILCYLLDPRAQGRPLSYSVLASNIGSTKEQVTLAIREMQAAKVVSRVWNRPLEVIDFQAYERAKAERASRVHTRVCTHCHGSGQEP